MAQTLGIAPGWPRCCVAAVIKAVLGFGCAVEIDDDFETGLARLVDCGVEVGSGTGDVRAPGLHVTIEVFR